MSRVKEYKKYLQRLEKVIKELKDLDTAICANGTSSSLFKSRQHLYDAENLLWTMIQNKETKL